MIRLFFPLLGLLSISTIANIARAEVNVNDSIAISAKHYVKYWRKDLFLREYRTPQIIRFASGSENTIWGGCVEINHRGEVIEFLQHFGSNYCSVTNTISLMTDQIEKLYFEHGDAAPFYLLSHELAHAIQHTLGYTKNELGVPNHELQADCIAGILARDSVDDLGINPGDLEEMVSAASAAGDKPHYTSHGTPEQRVYSLKQGFISGNCGVVDIQQIIATNPKIRSRTYVSLSSFSPSKFYGNSYKPKTLSDLNVNSQTQKIEATKSSQNLDLLQQLKLVLIKKLNMILNDSE